MRTTGTEQQALLVQQPTHPHPITPDDERQRQTLLLAAASNHFLWSFLPVLSRYLQVKSDPSMEAPIILSSGKLVALVLVNRFGNQLGLSRKRFLSPNRLGAARGGEWAADHGVHVHGTARRCNNNKERLSGQYHQLSGNYDRCSLEFGSDGTSPVRGKFELSKKFRIGLLYGTIATVRACLNVTSPNFTYAYNIALINSLTPILNPLADVMFLRTELPSFLWLSVSMTTIGCSLVALSQSPLTMHHPSPAEEVENEIHLFTARDGIGVALQFLSVCVQIGGRLLMKTSIGSITRDEMLQAGNVGTFLFPLAYSLYVHPSGWLVFGRLSLLGWLSWCGISVLIFMIETTMQLELVRALGPGLYTSFSGVRILGSVFLSTVLLREGIQNWVGWMGIIITVVTVTLHVRACLTFAGSVVDGKITDDRSPAVKEEKEGRSG